MDPAETSYQLAHYAGPPQNTTYSESCLELRLSYSPPRGSWDPKIPANLTIIQIVFSLLVPPAIIKKHLTNNTLTILSSTSKFFRKLHKNDLMGFFNDFKLQKKYGLNTPQRVIKFYGGKRYCLKFIELEVNDKTFSEDKFYKIKYFRNLFHLSLEDISLEDTVTDYIGQLRSLICLRIYRCTSMTHVNFLKNLKQIKIIWLSNCGNLENIEGLKELSELTLLNLSGNTELKKGSLIQLENCYKLETLNLASTFSTEEELFFLDKLKKLKKLSIGNTKIMNLRNIEIFQKLKYLSLGVIEMDDTNVSVLRKLTNLTKLTFVAYGKQSLQLPLLLAEIKKRKRGYTNTNPEIS